MVYAGSPAANAGISAGDRIVKIDESKIESVEDAVGALNNAAIGGKVVVQYIRDQDTKEVEVLADRLPTIVPRDLPSANLASGAPDAVVGMGETTEIKFPETPHRCHVYIPGSAAVGQSLGALLWLQSPSAAKVDEIVSQWQANCERDSFILIVPFPNKSDHWDRTDIEYLNRVLQRVVRQYKVDPSRVVIGGQGRTGSIAWLLAQEVGKWFAALPPWPLHCPAVSVFKRMTRRSGWLFLPPFRQIKKLRPQLRRG
jgi:membrane-associated protease RseP (regulator of RpoE activity)